VPTLTHSSALPPAERLAELAAQAKVVGPNELADALVQLASEQVVAAESGRPIWCPTSRASQDHLDAVVRRLAPCGGDRRRRVAVALALWALWAQGRKRQRQAALFQRPVADLVTVAVEHCTAASGSGGPMVNLADRLVTGAVSPNCTVWRALDQRARQQMLRALSRSTGLPEKVLFAAARLSGGSVSREDEDLVRGSAQAEGCSAAASAQEAAAWIVNRRQVVPLSALMAVEGW